MTTHVLESKTFEKDLIFPAWELMSYDNPIVGFQWSPLWYAGFNPILKDGKRTHFKPCGGQMTDWKEVKMINYDKAVAKIVQKTHNCSTVGQIQFFAADGTLLLQAGESVEGNRKEFLLEEGERIIGYHAKFTYSPAGSSAQVQDL